ncbi:MULTISPECIES: hypothetical protein [unclassified Paenibacillus]|uniref:hypothetical protein n=1 Tax=unclassified Paenibacillus TaxID=185978 RepID=UPI001C11E8EF|nr:MULTISPECIES: hypothetical protein [unclassified Paenibacillus]MBU5442407.1 hypothetical protein [Paenibacillus sp. MSJ-34]CAH0119443.1 hypothetical protein PAE9249_01946 [Paenibacillus sp. CECT 9249]
MYKTAYLIYVGLSLAYLAFLIFNRRPWRTDLTLIVCIPFVGLIVALWASMPAKRSKEEMTDEERFAHLVYSGTDNGKNPRQVDIRQEINLVPLEEALYYSDVTTRRRMLLDLLKTEREARPDLLEAAVGNDDTETSHYAVSAVTELKRKLTLMLQKLAVRYEQSPGDPELLLSYADALKRFLDLGFLDRHTQSQYRHLQTEVLERLLETGKGDVSHYTDMIEAELQVGNGDRAEYWTGRFYEAYPGREEPYLAELKLRYELGQRERLLATLQALRAAPIRVTPDALGVIRFWLHNSE